jgi:hypothetical protein
MYIYVPYTHLLNMLNQRLGIQAANIGEFTQGFSEWKPMPAIGEESPLGMVIHTCVVSYPVLLYQAISATLDGWNPNSVILNPNL